MGILEYDRMFPAVFQSRPNRFLAQCMLGGQLVTAHVKNTGRCRELLVPGARVLLQHTPAPGRKTRYTLALVQKAGRWVQIDSQAPNRLVEEALRCRRLALPGLGEAQTIRPETVYGQSRFDFYLEGGGKKAFAEVKGVTLEQGGWACFPDAPTQRGVKHLEHLAHAAREGYLCYVIFVIQMSGILGFCPNWKTHPAFAEALLRACEEGVIPLAFETTVTPEQAQLAGPVPVDLRKGKNETC